MITLQPLALWEMSLSQIFGGGLALFVIILMCIEIVPIKLSPLKWIGTRLNKDTSDKVDILTSKVDNLESALGEERAITCRVRILAFGDDVRLGIKHSKDSFDQVLDDIDYYEKYCNEHPEFRNNRTVLTTARIKEVYAHCLDQNSFL